MGLSDKELLSFCDLVNLKIEFAENVRKKEEADESVSEEIKLKYHTIHSLLEKEYKGIEERERLGIKEPSLSLEEAQFGKLAPIKIEEIRRKEKAYKEIIAVGEADALGGFYKSEVEENEIVVTDYIYQSKNEMRRKAPVIMECFDRYNEAIKKDIKGEHLGKFLTEWEVIYTADDYILSKNRFDFFFDSRIEKLEKTLALLSAGKKLQTQNLINDLKNIRAACPTRESVEDGIKREVIIKGIIKVMNSPLGEFIPGIPLNELKVFKPFSKDIISDLSAYDIIETIGSIAGKDLNEKGVLKTFITPKSRTNIPLKQGEIKYNIKFSFTGTSIRIGVFKNIKSKNIVFALADTDELEEIHKTLEKGLLPEEILRLKLLINSIEDEYSEYDITFTGVGNAGKLANILELVYSKEHSKSKYSSRGYFIDFPRLLPSIVDFTEKDLEDINTTFKYLTNQEIIITSTIGFSLLYGPLLAGLVFGTFGMGTFLVGGVLWVTETLKNILNKKLYKEYFEFLVTQKIIRGLNNSQIDNYNSEKIVGEVVADDFNNIFNYKGIKMELLTLLQLGAYEILFDYHIHSKTNHDLHLKKGNFNIKIKLEGYKIINVKKYKEVRRQGGLFKIFEELEEEDYFGELLFELLKVFKSIQSNYKKREVSKQLQGYYFEGKELKEIRKLSYKIEDKKNDYSPKNIVPFYFPFINEKGILTKELTKNYVASVVRSSIENDKGKKYYEETLEEDDDKVEEPLYAKSFSTVKHAIKSDETDKLVMRKVKKIISKGKVMHKEKLLEHLEPKGKIRDYYEVEEESETRGYLTLGIFNENLEYKTEEFGHVYHDDHLEGRVIEEKLVLYGKKEDLIKVTTTGVSSSAILRCDNGSIPSELKVTSQIGVTTNGLLDATEGDKAPFVNILPFGKCSLNRDGKGQPLPCEQFISPSKWSGASRGSTINGMKELISTSKIACKCGGEITILATISSEIKN